jgi:tetratricopeptide (TPR) repeat protein
LARLDAVLARQPFRAMPLRDRPYFELATLYAQAGSPQRARAMLAEREADRPDTTTVRAEQHLYHRALAEIALAERRGRDAVREFLAGDRLPDGPADGCELCLMANLGRAYDQAGDADSTIAVYERYVATPGWSKILSDARYLAGIRKRLGELYEAKGEREKAISHYSAFMELWSKADADLQPKVAEVRKRVERLSKLGGN